MLLFVIELVRRPGAMNLLTRQGSEPSHACKAPQLAPPSMPLYHEDGTLFSLEIVLIYELKMWNSSETPDLVASCHLPRLVMLAALEGVVSLDLSCSHQDIVPIIYLFQLFPNLHEIDVSCLTSPMVVELGMIATNCPNISLECLGTTP